MTVRPVFISDSVLATELNLAWTRPESDVRRIHSTIGFALGSVGLTASRSLAQALLIMGFAMLAEFPEEPPR